MPCYHAAPPPLSRVEHFTRTWRAAPCSPTQSGTMTPPWAGSKISPSWRVARSILRIRQVGDSPVSIDVGRRRGGLRHGATPAAAAAPTPASARARLGLTGAVRWEWRLAPLQTACVAAVDGQRADLTAEPAPRGRQVCAGAELERRPTAHRDAVGVQNWPIIEISSTQKVLLFIIF